MTPDQLQKLVQAAGTPEEERQILINSCIDLLEEGDFTEDDLRFLLVIITMFWDKRPAKFFEQLRRTAAEARAGESH